MIVGATNTNLVNTLKQCFTSDGQIHLQGKISYNWGFSISWFVDNLFDCVSVLYDAFLDEELFSIVKPIGEIISLERIEFIWSICFSRFRSNLITFLIRVATFLSFLKKSIEQSSG